jgi:hypothetical protein
LGFGELCIHRWFSVQQRIASKQDGWPILLSQRNQKLTTSLRVERSKLHANFADDVVLATQMNGYIPNVLFSP